MKWKESIVSRSIGALLLVLSGYMFANDVEYATNFDTYKGGGVEHHEFTFTYLSVLIIGLVIFFFREFMKYVYRREY